MPVLTDFQLPESPAGLTAPPGSSTFFVVFVSSTDPATQAPWCPEVRACLPGLRAKFTPESAPALAIVEVGERPEWRRPTNVYRTRWNIKGVPTMVRYREVDGEVTEDGRFEGSDVLGVEAMLDSLVAGEPFT